MKSRIPSGPGWKALLVVVAVVLISGCITYMKMNPPADSDKPLPVPLGDGSCWLHTASNILAGAGYGTGNTVQARADDIWADMNAQYGTANGGWIDAALEWWLASVNNTWTSNPYTLVTVQGNKTRVPWANANGARDIGNALRTCNMVGLSISWPDGHGGYGGHAITAWGDNCAPIRTLTGNPTAVRVADSDTDSNGNVQVYTYDPYTNPNPGGPNEGNGWYFSYGTPHPFIKHIATLSRTTTGAGANSVIVMGSYAIQQTSKQPATGLHYRVGTDVDILTYRTWLDWLGTPAIVEGQPRRELSVEWDFGASRVPQNTWVTINTELVEQSWNAISYHSVHFAYPESPNIIIPELAWTIETPFLEKAEAMPNVTGGYIIGSFDVYDPKSRDAPVVRYRLVHQYLYNQSPDSHTFTLVGTPGFAVANVLFSHSYGYPTSRELWDMKSWMTKGSETYTLGKEPLRISLDWKGRLPYPEGDR